MLVNFSGILMFLCLIFIKMLGQLMFLTYACMFYSFLTCKNTDKFHTHAHTHTHKNTNGSFSGNILSLSADEFNTRGSDD